MSGYEITLCGVCGLALALVIGYVFWVKIRVLRLKVHIIDAFMKLRSDVKRLDGLQNPAYLEAVTLFRAYFRMADGIFVPLPFRSQEPPTLPSPSPHSNVETTVKASRDKLVDHIARYMLFQTLSGLVVWIMSRFTRKDANSTARMTQNLPSLHHFAHSGFHRG